MKLVAAVLALFSRPTPAVVEIVEEPVGENVVPLQPVLDQRIQNLRKIAVLRLAYKSVPAELTQGMAEARREWLKALDNTMLLALSTATQQQIREHLAGRKVIRGLLAADPASVAAYLAAITPKVIIHDPNEGRRSGGGPRRGMSAIGMKMGR